MTPYVVAIVQLDEGARMMTNIVCNDPGEVRIGQRVAVEFDDVTETVTLPKFRIVPAPATGGAG
ncbi:Zn-ribbon domain-containing OB-fold protein [Cupriavidus sp. TA19]|nr:MULTISPECIES: OB-fold domain-containing protein [unclassified Cupriavidus]